MTKRKSKSEAQKRKIQKLKEQRDEDILKHIPKLNGNFKAAEFSSSQRLEDCQLASAIGNISANLEELTLVVLVLVCGISTFKDTSSATDVVILPQ